MILAILKTSVFFTMLLTLGCVTTSTKTVHINPGQSKQDVINIMGPPEDRQFLKKQEAWQYCSTGFATDDYAIIWFENNKVTGMNSYKNHSPGACSSFFKAVKWEQAPDSTVEFRSR